MTEDDKEIPFNDIQVEDHLQNLTCNDTQQRPFHVVLIDLKLAGRKKDPKIHCVEKLLDDPDLKYVALSYRWGELQETIIDTQVGYTASITSFDISDFYLLCKAIMKEVDMKGMDFVWVDAICVNQTDDEQRKVTVHQMSNIYERATYILAVPDLHLAHLKSTYTALNEMIHRGDCNSYIYHLIHGNKDLLAKRDDEWLDSIMVSKDPKFRQLLKKSTNYFTNGHMEYNRQDIFYSEQRCFDHLYESSHQATELKRINSDDTDNDNDFDHKCDLLDCPLNYVAGFSQSWSHAKITFDNEGKYDRLNWNLIQQRSTHIQQSMKLLMDLIKDWSSRVWVISEYNIAKKKNNMKYWFIQLDFISDIQDFYFFKFDFEDVAFSTAIQKAHNEYYNSRGFHKYNDPVYITFHRTMLTQLNQLSLFEMILKSKASKNEDRFYAIFPLTVYKSMITNKAEVDSWKINTLTSVRIKLFEVMNVKDKLNLLFISGSRFAKDVGTSLPTFGTSSPDWYYTIMDQFTSIDYHGISQCNFDLGSSGIDVIALCQQQQSHLYLNLKPKEYYILNLNKLNEDNANLSLFKVNRTLWDRLESKDPSYIVCIPSWTQCVMLKYFYYHIHYLQYQDYCIVLHGNFENNIWILHDHKQLYNNNLFTDYWIRHICDESNAGFNIY